MVNLTKEIILEVLNKNKLKLKNLGVKKLILFGSFARNEQKKTSDIDFLVKYNNKRGDYRDALDLLHFLEDLFNRKIDLGEEETLREELKPYILEGVQYEATI